jgi:hypothetical protein
MPTVPEMLTGLAPYTSDTPILNLLNSIQSSFNQIQTNSPRTNRQRQESREKGVANQNFFETAKQKGGDSVKTREQTLQEVVLYFFMVSILFLGAAIVLTIGVSEGVGAAFRTFLLYAIAVFIFVALLLRYA